MTATTVRRASTQITRIEVKGAKRSATNQQLIRVDRQAIKLTMAGVRPVQSYGHQATGASMKQIPAMRKTSTTQSISLAAGLPVQRCCRGYSAPLRIYFFAVLWSRSTCRCRLGRPQPTQRLNTRSVSHDHGKGLESGIPSFTPARNAVRFLRKKGYAAEANALEYVVVLFSRTSTSTTTLL